MIRKGNQSLPLYILYREGDTGDPFKSKALFGMDNVGVCKFWKFLSIHNKLETVDLFFSPPLLLSAACSIATVFFCAHLRVFPFLPCLEKDAKTSDCLSFISIQKLKFQKVGFFFGFCFVLIMTRATCHFH